MLSTMDLDPQFCNNEFEIHDVKSTSQAVRRSTLFQMNIGNLIYRKNLTGPQLTKDREAAQTATICITCTAWGSHLSKGNRMTVGVVLGCHQNATSHTCLSVIHLICTIYINPLFNLHH